MADVTMFHYKDAQGRDVITNDFKGIPPELRAQAQIVETHPGGSLAAPVVAAHPRAAVPDVVGHVHLPSAALGALMTLVVVGAVSMRKRARLAMRVVALAAGAVLLGGLYFGWVMRSAGLSGDVVASPAAAVDEARRAVDEANRATDANNKLFDKIEKSER